METPEDRKYEPIPGVDFKQDRARPRRPPDPISNLVKATLTIYLLPADEKRLIEFCDEYFNNLKPPDGIRFKPIFSYVYLTVMAYGEKEEPQEVAFSVPVNWYERGQVVDWALVSPFVFSETDVGAIVDRELNGRPTVDAKLTSKSGGGRGFDAGRPVLRLETEVLLDPDVNRPATDRTILEIYRSGEGTVARLEGLSEQIFQHGIKHVMLKQFRDADEPDRACYQAIVQFRWKIKGYPNDVTRFGDVQMILTQYANQPIAKVLGLKGPVEEIDPKGYTHKVVKITPEWALSMKVEMEQEERETVCWRVGAQDWQREPKAKEYQTGSELMKKVTHVNDPYEMIAIVFQGK